MENIEGLILEGVLTEEEAIDQRSRLNRCGFDRVCETVSEGEIYASIGFVATIKKISTGYSFTLTNKTYLLGGLI